MYRFICQINSICNFKLIANVHMSRILKLIHCCTWYALLHHREFRHLSGLYNPHQRFVIKTRVKSHSCSHTQRAKLLSRQH